MRMPSLVVTLGASPDILRPKVECFSSIYSFLAGSESSLIRVASSYYIAILTKGCLYGQKLSTTIRTLLSSTNSSLIAGKAKAKLSLGKYSRVELIERVGKVES